MAHTYRLIPNSTDVLRTSDGAILVADESNADWKEYQSWLLSNSPTSAVNESLLQARQRNSSEIDRQAEVQIEAAITSGQYGTADGRIGFLDAVRLEEARRVDSDGAPTNAEYPMLKGMVDQGLATDLADAGTLVRADWDTSDLLVHLGEIMAIRRKAQEDVDAAVSGAAADAVVASINWTLA